jgi:type I restriction enzyme S subunit
MKDLGRYHVTNNLDTVDDCLAPAYAARHNLTPIKAGAILMPRSGSVALNHRAILAMDAVIVSHICAIEVISPKLLNTFLYRYLCRVRMDKITKKTTGLDAINFADLRNIEVPIPPLAVQDKIASILDTADAVRAKQERALTLTDQLLKSVFLDWFGDPASNPKSLPVAPIKDFGRVITGNTPPRNDPANYGAGIEWIKSDNLTTPHFVSAAEETLTERGKAIARTVPAGSILVTCIAGSPSSIGNAAIADREVAFNQQINAVVPNRDVDPFFLYTQLRLGKRIVQGASTNSMKGMVSKGKFQEIKFLMPPRGDQKAFGHFFDNLMSTRKSVHDSCLDSEALFLSLSQRAFRGEL